MRIHRIDLYANDTAIARFDTDGPNPRNPYKLKGVAGLDADQIIPKFYGQGLVSATNFTSLALEPREVMLRIGIQPDWSIDKSPSELRGNLLKAIAANRTGLIQLRMYENEVAVGVLDGFITKFETPLSNKESEVTITVKCDNPLIRSLNVMSQIVEGLSTLTPLIIDPVSTAPHGFKFKLTFTGGVNPFIIQEPSITPDWKFQIDYTFLAGDELYFSSEENDKYIFRVRAAETLHLMDKIAVGSVWPILFPGDNELGIQPDTAAVLFDWDDVYWYETHWGI